MNFVLFIGILLLLGLMSSRVMRLVKLPNVTGYLIIGLLAALVCILLESLHPTLNEELTTDLSTLNSFISSIALGFIALSIGEEFKLSKLKELGKRITIVTFFQALGAVLLVDIVLIVVCLILKVNIAVAITLGAIAAATAPAATLMVIHQYKAKGPLVDILLPVVAFDDAIGLVIFAISSSISTALLSTNGVSIINVIILPLFEIIGSIAIGFLLGFVMHFIMKYFKSRNNHEVVIITFTILGVGITQAINQIKLGGEALDFSNLLTCMMIGATYVNVARDEENPIVTRDFELIDRWTPFLFMLFFVLSGTHLAITAHTMFAVEASSYLVPVIVIFVAYIIARSTGKYFGSYFGCKVTKFPKTITNYLGITLLPQAGVAIGMANQVSNMEAFETSGLGNIIVTVVLCATLLYELVGPLLTKWSLSKAGEIPDEKGNYPFEKKVSKKS